MATGDRQSVLRTTKVRNTLKGDNSWIQRRQEPGEEDEKKPWIAEVRASRVNGAFSDAPPEPTPTQPEPQPKPSTDSPKAPSSGYLIRGVFTKTDTKPTSPSSTNGYMGTSGFTKKPSDAYKKIAPHTVRSSLESKPVEAEPAISKEEQDRRTETASNILKGSAARQRSYVLSAAKKYESPPEKADSSDPPVISFVAKRVVINDDEDSDSAFEPPEAPVSPKPQAQPAAKQSSDALDALSDTLTSSTPAPTRVSKPVPEVSLPSPETKKAPSAVPEPKTESTPKPSTTEPATPAVPAAKEAPSTAAQPKAEPTPKPRVVEPDAPQKVPSTTPEPQPKAEPTPKPSVTKPVAALRKALSKQDPDPKQSVTEPSAQATPVAPVAAEKETPTSTQKAAEEPTPKSSVTEPVPAAPVTQKAQSTTPTPLAEPTPKPSVTEPVPAAPAAQTPPSTTPEAKPKTEPTPKPSVVDPVPALSTPPTPETKQEPAPKTSVTEPVPAAPVPQKTPSTTPEPTPKTEPAPKTSVTEPAPAAPAPATAPEPKPKTETTPTASISEPVPTAPAPQKIVSTTPEPKTTTVPIPTASVTAPVAPAAPPAQITLPATPEPTPRTEPTPKARVDPKPVEKTNGLNDADLLGLTQSTPQKPVNPVPTTTDLLTGDDSSLPKSEKTKTSLDLLAADVIPFDTNTNKLNTDKNTTKIETTQTIVQSKDLNSTTETVTITTTKTEIITQNSSLPQSQNTQKTLDLLACDIIPFDTKQDKLDPNKTQSKVETTQTVVQSKKDLMSSADPFDPIPIVSECTKSPVELFDPLLLDSENLPADALSSLAVDVIPIDTKFTSLSTDTSKERFDSSVPGANQRSSDNVSPWDEWTSPILNTTTETRETDPKPMETSYTAYTRKVERSDQEPQSQDPDSKKGLVYVKEYVNTPGLSTYYGSDLDYVSSTSSSYAYSSPSSENMTACTYCGGLVGNDAKITIEHLNISCHPECFKCGICSKPMGDFLDTMFLHRGTVHCENCYANVL